MASSSGRCLCGAVRFKFDIETVIWRGHCHCDTCRRACSAPVVTWFGVPKTAWRWFGEAPQHYQSSDWAERFFCGTCGSQVAYQSDKLPKEIHGLAACLDDPADFAPDAHFFHSKHLPWLHIADDLPRYVDGGKTLEQDAEAR